MKERQLVRAVITYKLLEIFPTQIATKIILFLSRNKTGESEELRALYEKRYNVKVDKYSYGGCFEPEFNNGGKILIGRYCSIAKNVRYFGANHPMENISTSAYFYNASFSKLPVRDVKRGTLIIENDVWIGYGAIITCSCKRIGTGAVIGAGSVVTKDVPDYAIVAGNPAKVIRYRFTESEQQQLKESLWWNYSPEVLMNVYEEMSSVSAFVDKLSIMKKSMGDCVCQKEV